MTLPAGPAAEPVHNPLAAIRARTRDLHRRLESSINLGAAFVSRESYRSLLGRYVDIYEPLESALDDAIALLEPRMQQALEWPRRRKLRLLERDLNALGSAMPPSDRDPRAAFQVPDLDSILGALYVIEGSTLGGQILYRQIHARLGLDARTGASFFLGYGPETGNFWNSFTALLQAHVTDPDQAAEAAALVFQAFLDHLPDPATSAWELREMQAQIQTRPSPRPAALPIPPSATQ